VRHGKFSQAALAACRELFNQLVDEGLDPNTDRVEWDEYADRRGVKEGRFTCLPPTPAFQEAWRRACAELPEAVAALERISEDNDDEA
jgi:hypothetical protein